MAFSQKTWVDGKSGGTPITAAELNRIETGVAGVDADQDALANLVTTLSSTVDDLQTALGALTSRVEALEQPAG